MRTAPKPEPTATTTPTLSPRAAWHDDTWTFSVRFTLGPSRRPVLVQVTVKGAGLEEKWRARAAEKPAPVYGYVETRAYFTRRVTGEIRIVGYRRPSKGYEATPDTDALDALRAALDTAFGADVDSAVVFPSPADALAAAVAALPGAAWYPED